MRCAAFFLALSGVAELVQGLVRPCVATDEIERVHRHVQLVAVCVLETQKLARADRRRRASSSLHSDRRRTPRGRPATRRWSVRSRMIFSGSRWGADASLLARPLTEQLFLRNERDVRSAQGRSTGDTVIASDAVPSMNASQPSTRSGWRRRCRMSKQHLAAAGRLPPRSEHVRRIRGGSARARVRLLAARIDAQARRRRVCRNSGRAATA